MRIFLTGGAGYIGSCLAVELLKANHHLTIYDSLLTGHQHAVPPSAKFIQGNLEDTVKLSAILGKGNFDGIIHLAASAEVGASMSNPGSVIRNNLINSLSLLEIAHQSGIKNFIFSSSYSIYKNDAKTHTEDSQLEPMSVYAYTKLAMEQALKWYHKIYGMNVGIARISNAAGATTERGEDHTPETHLIPAIIKVALGQAQNLKINGNDFPTKDGTPVRDYVHIVDIAKAVILIMDVLDAKKFAIYNISSGKGHSILEVRDLVRKISGKSIPIIAEQRRLGDPASIVASSNNIQSDFGWRPENSNLNDIIQTAWDWHKSNPDGYNSNVDNN